MLTTKSVIFSMATCVFLSFLGFSKTNATEPRRPIINYNSNSYKKRSPSEKMGITLNYPSNCFVRSKHSEAYELTVSILNKFGYVKSNNFENLDYDRFIKKRDINPRLKNSLTINSPGNVLIGTVCYEPLKMPYCPFYNDISIDDDTLSRICYGEWFIEKKTGKVSYISGRLPCCKDLKNELRKSNLLCETKSNYHPDDYFEFNNNDESEDSICNLLFSLTRKSWVETSSKVNFDLEYLYKTNTEINKKNKREIDKKIFEYYAFYKDSSINPKIARMIVDNGSKKIMDFYPSDIDTIAKDEYNSFKSIFRSSEDDTEENSSETITEKDCSEELDESLKLVLEELSEKYDLEQRICDIKYFSSYVSGKDGLEIDEKCDWHGQHWEKERIIVHDESYIKYKTVQLINESIKENNSHLSKEQLMICLKDHLTRFFEKFSFVYDYSNKSYSYELLIECQNELLEHCKSTYLESLIFDSDYSNMVVDYFTSKLKGEISNIEQLKRNILILQCYEAEKALQKQQEETQKMREILRHEAEKALRRKQEENLKNEEYLRKVNSIHVMILFVNENNEYICGGQCDGYYDKDEKYRNINVQKFLMENSNIKDFKSLTATAKISEIPRLELPFDTFILKFDRFNELLSRNRGIQKEQIYFPIDENTTLHTVLEHIYGFNNIFNNGELKKLRQLSKYYYPVFVKVSI